MSTRMRHDLQKVLSPIRYANGTLELLDQLALPTTERWVAYRDYEGVAAAIRDMVVRGAPAIGVTAAYGVALGKKQNAPRELVHKTLAETRPTAVNLFWALDRMQRLGDVPFERLEEEAIAIHMEDIDSCLAIGKFGAELLPEGTILTHCNAGALATGGYGTALGVIRAAHEAKKKIRVFCDETRPYLQGARLTAWELMKSGIDTTLITDNMAAHLMSRGEIQGVVVGADRIARNGDTANKIGTYSVALAAREHQIPFFVAAPRSTIDLKTPTGKEIPIEERSAREVTHVGGHAIAPQGVQVRHPGFDVTPAHLIAGIITEAGVARAPYTESLARLFQ